MSPLLGNSEEEGFKPVPGKALLPVLQEPSLEQPAPPPGPPPASALQPISKYRYIFVHRHPILPVVQCTCT